MRDDGSTRRKPPSHTIGYLPGCRDSGNRRRSAVLRRCRRTASCFHDTDMIDRQLPNQQFAAMSRLKIPILLAWCGIAAGALIFFLPPPEGAPPDTFRIAGVVVAALSLWATAALPEYFTAVIFFLLAIVLTDVSAPVVFSGFHSAAVWMVFGGLVLGAAAQETGLARRLANLILRVFPCSYVGLLAAVTVTATVMCFLTPSNTGRIVILLPIVMAISDRVGLGPGRPGRIGLAFAGAAGSIYPSFAILPAAVPNLGWLGAAENLHGITVSYGQYLVANFPVIGLVSLAVIPGVILVVFPDRVEGSVAVETETSADQTRLGMVLVAALGLWITDFAHGIAPAWIALAAAVICLLPRVGSLPPSALIDRISYAPWFFVAGVIGMGAVVAEAGLGRHIGALLFAFAPLTPGSDFTNFVILSAAGMGTGILTTIPGQPAIMTTLVSDITAATGWPARTALMVQPLAWGMAPFAYQFPPWILAASLAGVSLRRTIPVMLSMVAIFWIVMTPLQFLWLRLLGYFG